MVVSRGELIEIGDGFRIPDIMARSGAVLREVGTTNRTRIEDYRDAISERTRLLLRVHPSNFRITGFTARPELRELVALGRERGMPVYEDLGSGCMADLRAVRHRRAAGLRQPRGGRGPGFVQRRQAAGRPAGGDPGGQAARSWRACAAIRCSARCGVDKLIYQALENTLRESAAGKLGRACPRWP